MRVLNLEHWRSSENCPSWLDENKEQVKIGVGKGGRKRGGKVCGKMRIRTKERSREGGERKKAEYSG